MTYTIPKKNIRFLLDDLNNAHCLRHLSESRRLEIIKRAKKNIKRSNTRRNMLMSRSVPKSSKDRAWGRP